MKEPDYFDEFWEASSLDRFNIQLFSDRLAGYDSDNKELMLEYPQAPLLLPKVRTPLNVLTKRRRSERTFSEKPLSPRELSQVLSSFKVINDLEHRMYPSAGATYVTEIFCVNFNVLGPTNQKIVYYDAERHGVVPIADAPDWTKVADDTNITITGQPQMLVLFVMFPKRAVAKYGERGGRFALLETGAAMQQLALQIASSRRLKGCAAGGLLDNAWLRRLKLQNTDARLTLGYLVGK